MSRQFVGSFLSHDRSSSNAEWSGITYKTAIRIQRAYEKQLSVVEQDQAMREAEKILAEYDKMYSLEKTTTGIPVAVVDDDILSGIYAGTWDDQTLKKAIKAAKDALLKFNQGIAVRRITIEVNLTSREEYTKSNYSKTIEKRMPDVCVIN